MFRPRLNQPSTSVKKTREEIVRKFFTLSEEFKPGPPQATWCDLAGAHLFQLLIRFKPTGAKKWMAMSDIHRKTTKRDTNADFLPHEHSSEEEEDGGNNEDDDNIDDEEEVEEEGVDEDGWEFVEEEYVPPPPRALERCACCRAIADWDH
ncbi:hypothetical protein GCK32_021319 [Trichostrongylus colubriformis]|uniref:Uncharacterized protein n=1 Tax=Trichostrongylus colubriformis TaxID=6319 RepID=A0AAN8FMA9_TRICO